MQSCSDWGRPLPRRRRMSSKLRDASPPRWARRSAASSISTWGVLGDKAVLGQINADIKRTTPPPSIPSASPCAATPTPSPPSRDKYLSERVKDMHDVEKRLLKLLIGQKHED